MTDLIQYNKNSWNSYISNNNRWTLPVTEIDIKNAQNDIWSVIIPPSLAISRGWFPENMKNIKILGLTCGGGQQGPILTSLSADVTIFDPTRIRNLYPKKI